MTYNPENVIVMTKQAHTPFGKAVNFVVGKVIAELLAAFCAQRIECITLAPKTQYKGKQELFCGY